MVLEKKIAWLSPAQRKSATSCNDLGTMFHENVDGFQKQMDAIKEKRLSTNAPPSVIVKFDDAIGRLQQKRKDTVMAIWRDPVTRKPWGRNDTDTYYFMRPVSPRTQKQAIINTVAGFGDEWIEIDKEKHDAILDSLHPEWWDFLRCKFDPKLVTFTENVR